jgi:crotonobetainyl-CoA:carnitine CoA-transferase CaiB-like acyl-CoA transferase
MQGKESIQLDLGTPQGRDIVYQLARRSDIVLQPFRAGAAERAGVDEKSMLAVNPDLIYLNAPGYGTSGPWAGRPAYAPSVAAAVGIALADAPDAADAVADLASIKQAAIRLNTATAVPAAQADGLAAAAVASTMLLGWYAKVRGRPLEPLTVTMLATGTHAMLDRVVDFPGRPPTPRTDPDGYGLSALYRLYPAATGWIFLAAAGLGDWPRLVAGLADEVDLAADPRFGTARARSGHDADLAGILGGIFARAPAEDWEKDLTGHGVGCVRAAQMQPPLCILTDEAMRAEYAATTTSPIFEEHLRMGPAVRFSRSLTQAKGGCRAGEHTVPILRELGYPDSEIEDLRERKIIAGS